MSASPPFLFSYHHKDPTMKKFALGLLLLATSAVAVQQLDVNTSGRLTQHLRGILLGPKSAALTDARIKANRITSSLAASATIDFAIQASPGGCAESSAIAVVGAALGDACAVGAPVLTNADAGVLNGSFTCFVSAADAVKVRFCGIDNPASASFEVRTISNN